MSEVYLVGKLGGWETRKKNIRRYEDNNEEWKRTRKKIRMRGKDGREIKKMRY